MLRGLCKLIFKSYLKCYRWINGKMYVRFCQPLFDGLHPANVFYYRHEFFIENISPEDIVIDIACGTGKLLYETSPYMYKGYGIEINTTNFKLCNNKHNVDNIEYILGDIFKADYVKLKEITNYTVAFYSHILEHVEDVAHLLNKVNADKILICVPSQENWLTQMLKYFELPYFSCNSHYREYTREMLTNELIASGYSISSLSFNSEGELICCATKNVISKTVN